MNQDQWILSESKAVKRLGFLRLLMGLIPIDISSAIAAPTSNGNRPEIAHHLSSIEVKLQANSAIAPPLATDTVTASATEPMAQVTSVSQLSDVKPTDWAFQALQSLVDAMVALWAIPTKPIGAVVP